MPRIPWLYYPASDVADCYSKAQTMAGNLLAVKCRFQPQPADERGKANAKDKVGQ